MRLKNQSSPTLANTPSKAAPFSSFHWAGKERTSILQAIALGCDSLLKLIEPKRPFVPRVER